MGRVFIRLCPKSYLRRGSLTVPNPEDSFNSFLSGRNRVAVLKVVDSCQGFCQVPIQSFGVAITFSTFFVFIFKSN